MITNKLYTQMDKKKEELSNLANRLKDNLDEFKKPLIIEFTGTPKAGKTTCVDAIAKFFRRHKIPTHVVTERAGICPLEDKHHFFFNIWTGSTSLTQMLEALEKRTNVIILDRGVFDTLVWMNLHLKRSSISDSDFSIIETFFLLERWTSRIDIVVCLTANPATSLEREFQDQITNIPGSIMNSDALNGYNDSLLECIKKYENKFRRILHIDTTGKQTVEGVAQIATEVLSAADDLVDEQIAVVTREFISKFMPSEGIIIEQTEIENLVSTLPDYIRWERRTVAEENSSLVQIVPVGVIQRNGEILVTNIRGKKQGRLTDRMSIWVGGHLRRTDLPARAHKITMFRRCLIREIDEELRIRRDLDDLSPLPKAIIWDNTASKSIQHIALFFEINLDQRIPREVLHLRELWESPVKSLFTQFKPLNSELSDTPNLETWSKLFLKHIHGIDFQHITDAQQVMF